MARALGLVSEDKRVLHVHTTNTAIVADLQIWTEFWRKNDFTGRTAKHLENGQLIDLLASRLKERDGNIVFESASCPEKVGGCAYAMELAHLGPSSAEIEGSQS